MTTQQPGRFRFTLTHQILLGLALGCVIGLVAPKFATTLQPISQIFLRLIKMILGPLLITTLIAGIASTGAKMVGRLGVKAIIWFELATTVALVIGILAANIVKPGAGVVVPAAPVATAPAAPVPAVAAPAAPAGSAAAPAPAAAKPAEPPPASKLGKPKTFKEFVVDMFPTSMFDALARNDVLQILVFSVFLGLAVSAAGAKARMVRELAEHGAEAIFKLIGIVMRFAPFGVGAAIAVTLGSNGTAVLVPLLKCIGALYAALLVFFALLFLAMKLLTRTHMPTFLRAIREPAIIAFTTATSDAALPRAMQVLEQLGVPRRIVGFVMPTGYAFNLDGSTLYLSLAVLFVAQAAGVDMSVGEQIGAMLVLMVSTKGVAGVPRAALVVLAGTVTAFNLPPEGVAILLGIDAVMDMGRTCVNVVGNCVATVIVAVWERAIPPDAPIFTGGALAAPPDFPTAEVVREGAASDDT